MLAASKFNAQDTSPKLQLEFGALSNQLVRQAVNEYNWRVTFFILGWIRDVYLALHQDTNSALTRFSPSTGDEDRILYETSSYLVCNLPVHRPGSTPHIHDHSASTIFTPAVLHDNAAPLPASLAGISHALSTSEPTPLHVDENLPNVTLLENDMHVSASFHPVHQTSM